MTQQITTVATVVPTVTEEGLQRQLRKVGERESDLVQLAAAGWTLTHSHAIPGTEYTTFVDTLTRSE